MKAAMRDHVEQVELAAAGVELAGDLAVPPAAAGLVIFAHGSGSSRLSSRNRHVARLLNGAGLATLLFDLLTREEEAVDERTRELRFDIPLLSRRLAGAVDWAAGYSLTRSLPVGLFGASTGAAAALICAAERRGRIRAVVSRGGRPDLAGEALPRVEAPTLLIMGGRDEVVVTLNQRAAAAMNNAPALAIVPGATHLFEEPGALDQVAQLAADWFKRWLAVRA
jgi:putative phosphoribosyl transferase